MITTECRGMSSFMCGNFYHQVDILRDNELIETLNVFGCEDSEEASYYAVSISKELTQQEKEDYCY